MLLHRCILKEAIIFENAAKINLFGM